MPDSENPFPNWSVEKTYHWQQTFPAHKVLHVRHEYEPGIGFLGIQNDDLARAQEYPVTKNIKVSDTGYPPKDQLAREIHEACIDDGLKKILVKSITESNYVAMSWVDYILLTANNWKTPIRSFELIVEKDSRADYPTHFCEFLLGRKS